MKSVRDVFISAEGGPAGCRRCGAALAPPTHPNYCDACFRAVAEKLVEVLRADIAERAPGWEGAGWELMAVLQRLGRVAEAGEVAAELVGTDVPQDAKPPAPATSPTPPLQSKVAALLFASGEPVPVEVLAEVVGADVREVEAALGDLAEDLRNLGLVLLHRKSGVELGTLPELGPLVAQLRNVRPVRELTVHAKETLFILMRRGRPCTKAEIAEVRGRGRRGELIDVGPVLKTLRKEGLVARAGVRECAPGRPSLYVATKKAQERFRDLSQEAAGLLAPEESPPP